MAEGSWVPCFDSIWTSQKTKALARAMNVRSDTAAGLFLRLLMHARDHVEHGDLGGVPADTLATWAGLGADFDIYRSKAALLPALKAAKLVTDDARAHVIGWEDGPGRLVAKRRKERDRKAEERRRDAAERATKSRAQDVEDERQKRIDQARLASSFSTSSEVAKQERNGTPEQARAVGERSGSGRLAVDERSTSAPPSAPSVSAGQHPQTPTNTEVMPEGSDSRPRDVTVHRERQTDIPPTPVTGKAETGRARRLSPVGRPDCGRCRDPWFVHPSQTRQIEVSYLGDCATCAKRGTGCDGYTSEPIDPEIPDEGTNAKEVIA